jgi:electron transport complex protein RnfB
MQYNNEQLIQKIDDILPQTQCRRCNYPSCKDYAMAIVNNTAKINQCPPGGQEGVKKIADILHTEEIALNTKDHGEVSEKKIAIIDEDVCIGCTLCIKACPVDAIIGSNKMIHSVITSQCSGCDLCLPVCPVDCIEMITDPIPWDEARKTDTKIRFERRNIRLSEEKKEKANRLKQKPKIEL